MQARVIFAGLATGALLSAAGLAIWNRPRKTRGLSDAIGIIRWLAGLLLLTGGLLEAWQAQGGFATPTLHLALMAALAAPPEPGPGDRPSLGHALHLLPALGLAVATLLVAPAAGAGNIGLESQAAGWMIAICAGLGARALGQALLDLGEPGELDKRSDLATATPSDPTSHSGQWPMVATCGLLTLLAGGTALANLWQWGTLWGMEIDEAGLAGAWLAWSGVGSGPARPRWARAALTIVAALLLILAAV